MNETSGYAYLRLPSGEMVLFDYPDLPKVAQLNWHIHQTGRVAYARGRLPGSSGPATFMHRLIVNGPVIDHINGNGLDNRRSNLRPCTQAQNSLNSRPKRGKKYKGVFFRKDRGLWWAQIAINRKRYFGGFHQTPENAARAYDELARKHHGEFARLNLPTRAHSGPTELYRISWEEA